jgi:hypothetical protein
MAFFTCGFSTCRNMCVASVFMDVYLVDNRVGDHNRVLALFTDGLAIDLATNRGTAEFFFLAILCE